MTQNFPEPVTRSIFFALHALDEIAQSPKDVDWREMQDNLVEILSGLDDGLPTEEQEAVKYALVAWIDERFGQANWKHAKSWASFSLERRLFRTQARQWRFFELAEKAVAKKYTLAIRVFEFCLAEGFQGKYGNNRVPIRLNDPLPMRKHAESEVLTPALVGTATGTEIPSTPIHSRQIPERPSHPEMQTTLDAWCKRTFGKSLGIGPNPAAQKNAWANLRWSEWTVVAVIGLLVFAVLATLGV